MLSYQELRQSSVLNIFTDASIVQHENGTFTASAGAHLYIGMDLTNEFIKVLPGYTVNMAEITAIQYGISMIPDVRVENTFKTINLFSDSQLSVKAIRDWIYEWINHEKNGILYGSAGPVSNQNYYIHTVNYILANNIKINIYHVRGHFDRNKSTEKIKQFKRSLCKANNINYSVDDYTVHFLIDGNSWIDNRTRGVLYNTVLEQPQKISTNLIQVFNWHDMIQSFDLEHYRELTGGYSI